MQTLRGFVLSFLGLLRNWSLMVKIPVTVVGVVLILAGTLLVPVIYQTTSMQLANMEKRINALLTAAINGTLPHLMLREYWPAFDFLSRLKDSQSDLQLKYIVILDAEHRVFAATDPRAFRLLMRLPEGKQDGSFTFSSSGESLISDIFGILGSSQIAVRKVISVNGVTHGTALSVVELDQLKSELWEIVLTAIFFTALASLACGGIGYAISKEMMRPLSLLQTHVEKVARGEIRFIDPSLIHAQDEIYRLMVDFNNMAGALLEKQKITDRLAIEGQLAALGKLTASMAHEINNPLGGMLNVVSTLNHYGHDATVRTNCLDILERGIKQIQSIVHAALLSYRYDNDSQRLKPSDLEDIRLLIQNEVRHSRIDLSWANGLAGGFELPAVPIRQLAMNLLLNGCEAMPDGGELEFTASVADSTLSLVVADTGGGMVPELVERLNARSYYMDDGPGGIGLWICLQIINQLNGNWHISSEPGKGTRIGIQFPAMEQESGHGAHVSKMNHESSGPESPYRLS